MKRICVVLCVVVCLAAGGCSGMAYPGSDESQEKDKLYMNSGIQTQETVTATPGTPGPANTFTTPDSVVKCYFDRWAAKDISGMNSCLLRRQIDDVGDEQSHILSLQLQKCDEVKSLSGRQLEHFEELGYKDAFEKTIVNTVFVIECDDSGLTSVGPGKTTMQWVFNLVRETESSDWRIISFGG